MTHALSPVAGTSPASAAAGHGPELRDRGRRAVVRLHLGLQRSAAGLQRRALAKGDRGDVPGWVLVTLMTAGLVLVLWGVARDRLTQVFNDAITNVVGAGH
ncbi:MAG TPA: hypothetical protein VFP72_11325 [Kineosporiaceae bacterium]|nr:hypothetical protein [Kineosporiaceae bacterium]